MKKKIKTLLYPFDDESKPYLTFDGEDGVIDIVAVDTPKGWGKTVLSTKNINMQIEEVELKEIELLWLVDSVNKLTSEELEKRFDFFTQKVKKVLISRKFSTVEMQKLKQIADTNSAIIIEEKEITKMQSEMKFKELGMGYALKDIDIPIVMIAGMGEYCNKFELELIVAGQLKNKGYTVSVIASRMHVDCLGIHSFPELMYSKEKNECEKIIAYNNYIKYLAEVENPDVFVIGVPGGILPSTRRQPENFGIYAFEIFSAMKPDYMIFNLYNADVENKYFDEISILMKYKFGVEVDAFYISNYVQDGLSLNTFMPIKYIMQDADDIEKKWMNGNANIFYKNRSTFLVENLIDTLNSYKEIEVL